MKKVVITAIGTLMLSSVLLLSVGCGGRLVSTPLYGKTVTFTGKTMPVDWDGQTGAGYADGESETPVGDLIEKYFEEIDWDYTAECDNYEILANLTEADKASPDAFMAYIDTVVQERGIYAGLEGTTVTVGSMSDEVEVVFSAPDGKEYRYTCTDTSPGRDGTVLSSEMLSGENWSGNASFATSWNGVREYFWMNVPDIAPPMGIGSVFPFPSFCMIMKATALAAGRGPRWWRSGSWQKPQSNDAPASSEQNDNKSARG